MKTSNTNKTIKLSAIAVALALGIGINTAAVHADASADKATAPLKPGVPYLFVVHQGRSIRIERAIYDSHKVRRDINSSMLHQAGSCPPFCIQPISLDVPVDTIAEAELVDFMLNQLRDGTGTLVDVRTRRNHESSTIPGSVNFSVQDILKGAEDEKFKAMLSEFGVKPRGETGGLAGLLESAGFKDAMLTDDWDFTEAKELVFWANSAMDGIPAKSIGKFLEVGYPASKLKWYRGGLASWEFWGFNTYTAKRR